MKNSVSQQSIYREGLRWGCFEGTVGEQALAGRWPLHSWSQGPN